MATDPRPGAGSSAGWVVALVALYGVSRAPFLGLGYGLDDDAWLLARAADILASGGGYVPSRLPGYPTVELVHGALFRLLGPSFAVGNVAAACAGLAAAVGVWLLLAGAVGRPARLAAAVAVALHPALWTASVTTLDPVWGVAFLVGAAVAAHRRRPLAAGVLLGLATGCRITHALVLVPLVLVARARGLSWSLTARMAAAAAAVGGALFLLPVQYAGLGFLTYQPALHRDFLTGGYKVYRDLVGMPLAIVALATVVAVLASGARRSRLASALRDPLVLLGGTTTAILSVPFLLLPTDPQYLLGWVPFVAVAAAGLLRAGALPRPLAVLLVVAAVTPSAVRLGELDLDAWRIQGRLQPRWVAQGHVPAHHAERAEQLRRADAAARFSYPAGAAVVVGRPFMPTQLAMGADERQLQTYLYQPPGRDLLLFRLIPPWMMDRVEGRPVYYAAGEHLPYLTWRIFGYRLADIGASPLEIWPVDRSPAGRTGSAPGPRPGPDPIAQEGASRPPTSSHPG